MTQTARAALPRGFADRSPAEIAATEKMLAVIKESYELYGFEAVETPLIEFTEALGKFLPDQDRPNEGVFSSRTSLAIYRNSEIAVTKTGSRCATI